MLLIIHIFHKTDYRLYTYRNSIFKHLLWYIASVVHLKQYRQQQTHGITLYYGDTYIVLIICLVTLYVSHHFIFSRFVTLPHSPILKHKLRHQTHMPMRTWNEEEDAKEGEQYKQFGILPTTVQLAEQNLSMSFRVFLLKSITQSSLLLTEYVHIVMIFSLTIHMFPI